MSNRREIRRRILERDGHACVYCRSAAATTIDHVMPIVAGGTWRLTNLVSACAACNQKKADLTMDVWLAAETPAFASTIRARVHAARMRKIPRFTVAEHEVRAIAQLEAMEADWVVAGHAATTAREIRLARKGLKEVRRRLDKAKARLVEALRHPFPGPPKPDVDLQETIRYRLPDDP